MTLKSMLSAAFVRFRFVPLTGILALLTTAPLALAGTPALQFPATAVGATATTMTATLTFNASVATSATATTHYGLDYTLGTLNCAAPVGGTETCTVPVTFKPTLPGGRKDAIFLTNKSTGRLTSLLLYGIGNAPFSAIQPGVVTTPPAYAINAGQFIYDSAIDENGTVFFNGYGNLYKYTKAGVLTTLVSNVGNLYGLSIDGAGILYYGQNPSQGAASTTINMYDTVQGTQGTVTVSTVADAYYNVSVDGLGNVFALGSSSGKIAKVSPAGTITSIYSAPSVSHPFASTTDSAGDYFIAGFQINELTPAFVQTQINAASAANGIAADAAGTLVITTDDAQQVPTELAASNYAGSQSYFFNNLTMAQILGEGQASNGTLYFGALDSMDIVDRSQGVAAFNNVPVGSTSSVQTLNILNIGNQPLTYSSIALTGAGFALVSVSANQCGGGGIVLAPGASCNIDATFTSPHAGSFTGSITLISNSLNNTQSTQTIALTANTTGVYITASPSSLAFANQAINIQTTQAITVTNQGYATSAGISFLSGSPNFNVSAGTCTAALAPNATCQINVTFAPSSPQAYSSTVTITGGGGGTTSTASVAVSGLGLPSVTQTGGGGNNLVQFSAASVATTSPQTLTATFTVTGYSGIVTPTATAHYGLDYKLGAVTCTALTSTSESCSVPVTFKPTLPGGRKDAIFLTNGSTRLASVLLYGIGNSGFSAIQPGVITTPLVYITAGAGNLSYSAIDENGTVFFVGSSGNMFSLTRSGTLTLLASNVAGYGLAIDGAGILYYATNTTGTTIATYDTVQNIPGSVTVSTVADFYSIVNVDGVGDVFALGTTNQNLYKVAPTGANTSTALNPYIYSPAASAVDSAGDIFINGATINEVTAAGVQTQIDANGVLLTVEGIQVDAAGTLLVDNQKYYNEPTELPASNYAGSPIYGFTQFGGINPSGSGLASNGTIYFGVYGEMYVFDRSQGAAAFSNVATGSTAAAQTLEILNIGNQPLTYSSIALTGAGFAISSTFADGTAITKPCGSGGIVLAAGAYCTIGVTFTSPHPGSFTGAFTLISNSLNNATTTQTIALTANTPGVYLSVNPTTLNFGNQVIGTTSAPQTITFTNSGTVTAQVYGTSFGAPIGVTLGSACSNIAVGATCTATVTYGPNSVAAYNSTGFFYNSAVGTAGAGPNISLTVTGNGLPVVTQTTGGTNNTLIFTPAAVGIAAASAQTLTATFTIAGYSSLVTPTAAMHYGLAYTAGAVTCTGAAGAQTCSVPVTFTPNYPGGRKDALFLTVGGVRIATALVYGIGQSPFALIQPGVITQPVANNANYQYRSVVDENGTAYIVDEQSNQILTITKAGVVATLPITGLNSPREAGIDGAGVLYIADQTPQGGIKTYDTVQGTQGIIPFPSAAFYIQGVTVGNTGNIYETDSTNVYTVPISGSGTAATTAISPANTQANTLVVDSNENVFVGGYQINELPKTGAQTQVNTVGAGDGLGVDAAGTLYATRYTGTGGVAELPASNYAQFEAAVDVTAPPLGASVGPDGTVYVGNYSNVDKVDRSQGAIAFGEQQGGAATQTITMYNGGNTALTLSSISITGIGFTLSTASSQPCSTTQAIAPGALCQIAVTFTTPHAGSFTGTVTIVSNSLNNASTSQTVALSAFTYGVYVTATPSTLAFGNQTTGTASAPTTITFTNNGLLYAAYFGAPTASNPAFTFSTGTCGINLAVGASCQMTATFKPTLAQPYSATATVSEQSSGGGPDQTTTITLSGTGVAPSLATATLVPTALSFGGVVGTPPPPQVVTVFNNGTAALTPITPTFTGTNASLFSQTNTCNNSLAAGASCTISITFTPTAAATGLTANLSLADNAANSPQIITLTGVAYAFVATPQLQFTPAVLNTFAGTGVQCTRSNITPNGDGGPATGGVLCGAFGSATDQAGNTYIVDQTLNVVRMVNPAGVISTFAGTQSISGGLSNGDGGPANQANLNSPVAVAVDPNGNVLIEEYGALKIRRVDHTTGNISTLYAGSPTFYYGTTGALPFGGNITFDFSGNLYMAGAYNEIIVKITPSGTPSIYAGTQQSSGQGAGGYAGDNGPANQAKLNVPMAVAFDRLGNGYIADMNNNVVRKVDVNGVITTFAGNGTAGYTGDGGLATAASLTVNSVTTDLAGDVFVIGGSVRKIDKNGIITTVIGGALGSVASGIGGPAPAATISAQTFGSVDLNGSLIIPALTQTFNTGPNGILVFPSQTINTTSAAQTILFENTGNTNLSLGEGAYIASAPFTVTGGTCNGLVTITPGATCTLLVTFTPTVSGPASGSISVTNNAAAGRRTILLQGTGAAPAGAPAFVFNPSAISFGNQTVGTTSAVVTSQITNTGTAPLNISNVTLSTQNVAAINLIPASVSPCGSVLAVNASCNFAFTFAPPLAGNYSATLTVTSNTANSPQSLLLTGVGAPPAAAQAVLTPTSLTFASTNIGVTTATQALTLSNPGNATLTINAVTIPNYEFNLAGNTCGTSLAAGATCTYSIAFAPNASGPQTTTLTVMTNVGNTTATLSGTGVALTPQATLAPTSLTFTATTSTAAYNQSIALTNSGNATLNISSVTLTGANPTAFTLLTSPSNPCGMTLAAGATCNLYVGMTTSTVGTYSASVLVTDNASPTTQVATLNGTVTGIAQGAFTPASLNFSATTVATASAAQTLTFTNSGTAPLTGVGSITIGGTGAAAFAQTSNCPTTLNAGASCTINVTFTPSSATLFSATLSISSSLGSQSASLAGTGTAAPAAQAVLTPASLTFPNTTVGLSSAGQTVTLTNPGNATLTVTSITIAGSQYAISSNTCGASVAAGGGCSFLVTFAPTATGTQTAAVNVVDSVGTQTVALSGTGVAVLAPQAVITPTALAFPSTPVGIAVGPLSITITNPGNAILTISSIIFTGANVADYGLVASNCNTIAPNGYCAIAVTFMPVSVGSFPESIVVTSNATPAVQTITLTGTGTASATPQALLTPAVQAFPTTTVGTTSSPLTFTLSNPGTAALTIGSIALAGVNPADFALTSTCGATLAASASCTLSVTFTPISAASFAAAINVTDNATPTTQSVTLTGTGTAPLVAQAVLTPTSATFASTTVGAVSAPLVFTLSNAGTAALNITGIAVAGSGSGTALYGQTTTCGSTLAAAASCTISITFSPQSAATFTATLSVTDSATGSPQVATLSGTGVPVPVPVAVLTPTTLTFPSTSIGSTTAAQTATLTNTGTAALTISGVTLTGTNPAVYAQTNTCGTTLAPAASCTFSVTFTPSSAASFSAALSVADNAAGSPQTVALTGTGASPADYSVATPNPAATVNPGGLAIFNLNVLAIAGNYNAPVTLSASGLPPGATATFSPVTVTPGIAGAASVLSIQTSPQYALLHMGSSLRGPALAALLLLPLAGMRRVRRRLRRMSQAGFLLVLLLLSLAAMVPLTGCSGGYFGAPAQSFTVTVTGTSGSVQHSTTVSLTIQ